MILKFIPSNVRAILIALLGSLVLIAADAVLNANDIRVSVHVSNRAASDGFSQSVVEEILLHDINQIAHTKSLVQSLAVRTSGSKTIVSVIADALSLNNFTSAVQSTLGIDTAQITATLSSEQGQTSFVLVGNSPAIGDFDFVLTATEGSIRDLLRRAALWTMIHIEPYQAFLHRIGSDPDLVERKKIAIGLERVITDITLPLDSERRGLLLNLKGILHLLGGEVKDAERIFTRVIQRYPMLAVGYINLAFVQVQQNRYAEAILTAQRGLQPEPKSANPALLASLNATWGVAAWGLKDMETAEMKLRAAIELTPKSPGPHLYLAGVLEQVGRLSEAQTERELGTADLKHFREYPEVANLYFWMSPIDDMPLTRRTLPPPLSPRKRVVEEEKE